MSTGSLHRGASHTPDGPGRAGSRPASTHDHPGRALATSRRLVERSFSATRPNALWVADLTYVATWSGFAYTAFIVDVLSRRIVAWRVATTLWASLALDALEMAIWSRQQPLEGLVHHSD